MFFHRRRHRRHLNKITQLSLVSLIACFAFAQIDAIWSVYIESFVHNDAIVGLVTALFTFVALAGFFLLVPFFEKHRPDKLYLMSLFGYAIAYALFAFTNSFGLFLIIGLAITILHVIRTSSMGVLIRDISKVKQIGKDESLMYAVTNIAWLFGPLIAGFASEQFSINSVFLLSAFFALISAFSFKFSKIKDRHVSKKVHKNVFKNFKAFFSRKNLVRAYIIRSGLEIWWALVYIYVPLLIIGQGKSIFWVGAFLFFNTIPLISLEYFFGKRVDKIGYRKHFIWGYGIFAVCGIVAFIVASNLSAVLIVLIVGSIGGAMLEASSEAYFFKLVKKKDESIFYGPFITADDVGWLIGSLILAGAVAVFAFKSVFLVTAIAMILVMMMVFKMKRARCSSR